MKLLAVLSALLFVGGQHLVMAESERRSVPHVDDVVFGLFNCSITSSGLNAGLVQADLSMRGTIGSGEGLYLTNRSFSDDPTQACEDARTLVKAKAESSGCVAALGVQLLNVINYDARGFSFTCVGSRSEVVAAMGAMGEELLRFLSSLDGDR